MRNPWVQLYQQEHFESEIPDFDTSNDNGKYLRFKSFDHAELEAFITYSKLDHSKGTIILLHGIRAYKEHFINLSELLSKRGYNTVALDSRAHGKSGGQHCTYGINEKKDVSALISALELEDGLEGKIGVWGQSLGGAIGLQALSYDDRIAFGIIESTFTDFRTITHDYITYHAGFDIPFISDYLIDRAGMIAGFNPDKARPLESCKNIHQPILLIHGEKDRRINIKYSRANLAAIPSLDKQLIEIPDANHLNVWQSKEVKFFNLIFEFLDRTAKKV